MDAGREGETRGKRDMADMGGETLDMRRRVGVRLCQRPGTLAYSSVGLVN